MDGDGKVLTDSGQVVTLGIGKEVFAVPVEQVREILDLGPITHLPYAPPHLLGLIDVRGEGVPVIDLRLKLGLEAAEASEHTRILVLECQLRGRTQALGLLTDRVYEVTALDSGDAIDATEIGRAWRSDYIERIGRRGGNFVIVLNLGRLFADDHLSALVPQA